MLISLSSSGTVGFPPHREGDYPNKSFIDPAARRGFHHSWLILHLVYPTILHGVYSRGSVYVVEWAAIRSSCGRVSQMMALTNAISDIADIVTSSTSLVPYLRLQSSVAIINRRSLGRIQGK